MSLRGAQRHNLLEHQHLGDAWSSCRGATRQSH